MRAYTIDFFRINCCYCSNTHIIIHMNNINITDTRKLLLDLIKIIAMCMVVCLHTTYQFICSNDIDVSFILYNSSVVAIPLFFMVSGYLLLGRSNITYKYPIQKNWNC